LTLSRSPYGGAGNWDGNEMAKTPEVEVDIANLLRAVFNAGVLWERKFAGAENDDDERDGCIQGTCAEFVKQSMFGEKQS
jgi:hypothetical protein